jgi:hypothetical protein
LISSSPARAMSDVLLLMGFVPVGLPLPDQAGWVVVISGQSCVTSSK